MYQIVDEEIIISAAKALKSEPGNSFERALAIAEEYREADLTPVFILNYETKVISVTTQELVEKKYH